MSCTQASLRSLRKPSCAAHALGGVEQHVGLGGERVAQDAHAGAVDDQIAATEVAEGDRQSVRPDDSRTIVPYPMPTITLSGSVG